MVVFKPFVGLLYSLVVGSFVLIGQISMADDQSENEPPLNTASIPEIDHIFTESPDDHSIGHVKAPVTLIAYASVTCPHCSTWFKYQWPLVKKNLIETGQVRFVFREFPTAPAQQAMAGFLIANCAAKGSFFKSIEHQMQRQDDIFAATQAGNGETAYIQVAIQAGLNGKAGMEACFNTEAAHKHIYESRLRATHAKLQSVPAFFINGKLYSGDHSAAALTKFIDNPNP